MKPKRQPTFEDEVEILIDEYVEQKHLHDEEQLEWTDHSWSD